MHDLHFKILQQWSLDCTLYSVQCVKHQSGRNADDRDNTLLQLVYGDETDRSIIDSPDSFSNSGINWM